MIAKTLRRTLACVLLAVAPLALAATDVPTPDRGALTRDLLILAANDADALGCLEACDGAATQCKRTCAERKLTNAGEQACKNQCDVDRQGCTTRCPVKR